MEVEALRFKKKGVQGDGARNVYLLGMKEIFGDLSGNSFGRAVEAQAGGGG